MHSTLKQARLAFHYNIIFHQFLQVQIFFVCQQEYRQSSKYHLFFKAPSNVIPLLNKTEDSSVLGCRVMLPTKAKLKNLTLTRNSYM